MNAKIGINLLEEAEDLHLENCEILVKEIEDNIKRWKHILYSGIGMIDIVKMIIPPKAICSYNVIHIKILMAFFTELKQIILKIVWKHKRT